MPFFNSVEPSPRCTFAIVGAGFSGSTLAVHLLLYASDTTSIVLVEREPKFGPGLAYAGQFEGNLLNVPANNMSAYPHDPSHFVKWAQRNFTSSVKPDDFLPRFVYGHYIASQLKEAASLHPHRFRCIQGQAVSLTQAGHTMVLRLACGQTVVADKIVLALGNFPPSDPPLPGKTAQSSRYVANPWSCNSSVDVHRDKALLLIGSGLTSVDLALELRARGFTRTIHILSRRGLLPLSHKATVPFPPFWSDISPRTVRGLLRLIRLQEARGSDWRSVIDSLRPFTQEIWRTLPEVEQRRFLRHLRPYWDVHRHRISEQVAEQFASHVRSGQFQMLAGRITEYREDSDAVQITYRDRRSGNRAALRVDRVVNCTGPATDYRRDSSPLLADLIDKKLARPDALSLGLDVSDDGAVLDAQGTRSDSLYALGPLRKGCLWETTAVPEIRVQASELAKLLSGNRSENVVVPGVAVAPNVPTALAQS